MEATAFPPPQVSVKRLYLDTANATLSSERAAEKHHVQYRSKDGQVFFTHTFQEDTTLCGPLVVSLAVSVAGHNDADIFVNCEKVLADGKSIGCQLTVPFQNAIQATLVRYGYKLGLAADAGALFYRGPKGQVRVSRRMLEHRGEIPGFPVTRMEEYHPVTEAEMVTVQPPMSPIGMVFRKGEKLKVRFGGVDKSVFPPVDQATLTVDDELPSVNARGHVTIYSGYDGESSDSWIDLPVLRE